MMFGVVGIGLLFQPGLAFLLQAASLRARGDIEKLRTVERQLVDRPGDFRCQPARRMAEAGLRGFYASAVQQLSEEEPAKKNIDQGFRDAFRQLVEDLSTRLSPRIVVHLDESLDPTEPPEAKAELLVWKLDPDLHWPRSTPNDGEPQSSPLVDFRNALTAAEHQARRRALADALGARLRKLLPSNLASWGVSDGDENLAQPRVEFRGRFKHSGHFVKMTTTFTNPLLPGNYCSLYAVPIVIWDVRLIDGTGHLLGQTSLAGISVGDKRFKARDNDNLLGPYGEVLAKIYENTADEFRRRIGVEAKE